jgi:hypothetical protein
MLMSISPRSGRLRGAEVPAGALIPRSAYAVGTGGFCARRTQALDQIGRRPRRFTQAKHAAAADHVEQPTRGAQLGGVL